MCYISGAGKLLLCWSVKLTIYKTGKICGADVIDMQPFFQCYRCALQWSGIEDLNVEQMQEVEVSIYEMLFLLNPWQSLCQLCFLSIWLNTVQAIIFVLGVIYWKNFRGVGILEAKGWRWQNRLSVLKYRYRASAGSGRLETEKRFSSRLQPPALFLDVCLIAALFSPPPSSKCLE